jgi:hypothetical protein
MYVYCTYIYIYTGFAHRNGFKLRIYMISAFHIIPHSDNLYKQGLIFMGFAFILKFPLVVFFFCCGGSIGD